MTTTEFITFLLENCAATLTRQRALFYVNLAQNKILGTNHPLMRVQPDAYFETVDDTYSYVASLHCRTADSPIEPGELVGDVRSISRIYAFLPRGCGIWGYWGFGISPWNQYVRPERVQYGRGEWSLDARWAVVQSEKPGAQDCLIKWQKPNNPGETELRWFAEAYLWPNQLTSENVQLKIPEDFQTDLLLEATLALVERREYGRADYSREAYEAAYKRLVDKYANTAVQEDTWHVPFREV